VVIPDNSPAILARRVFDEMLDAMDAGRAVERAVRVGDGRLHIFDDEFDLTGGGSERTEGGLAIRDGGRAIYSVALGKAAGPMAAALDRVLGGRLAGGVISAPPLPHSLAARLTDGWRVHAGGHPLPNESSLAAAVDCFELLRRADEEAALIIFLVSGGGSAMLEWPRERSTTLEDLREANRVLVGCGASISEVNAVRRAFSAVKGGGLARLAPSAAQVTLIVSDTCEGEEYNVASGPTLAPPALPDAPSAREVVSRYGLAAGLPTPILAAVERHAAEEASMGEGDPPRRHHVLLSNASAVERAAEVARRLGCAVELAQDISDQHVEEGARLLVSRLLGLRARVPGERPVCLVSGGEFACPVRGGGRGGRSSETALRCALELEARSLTRDASAIAPRLALLFAGTDGRDGNSPAAGALCDETTAARARALGLDPQQFLAESDSHALFDRLGDALFTGDTGTNVRDLRILVAK
jgi:hydroxypyruvate reductase